LRATFSRPGPRFFVLQLYWRSRTVIEDTAPATRPSRRRDQSVGCDVKQRRSLLYLSFLPPRMRSYYIRSVSVRPIHTVQAHMKDSSPVASSVASDFCTVLMGLSGRKSRFSRWTLSHNMINACSACFLLARHIQDTRLVSRTYCFVYRSWL